MSSLIGRTGILMSLLRNSELSNTVNMTSHVIRYESSQEREAKTKEGQEVGENAYERWLPEKMRGLYEAGMGEAQGLGVELYQTFWR